MTYTGSYQSYDNKTMAKVAGTHLPISPKDSREIARAIKGKSIDSAITYLQAVADGKQAVPFKKFNRDTPHRKGKGFGAGRFPKKASEHILKLLKHLKANASDKNLDADNLQLVHVATQRGPVLWHYGRIRGRRRKCTHFEAVAEEVKKKDTSKPVSRAPTERGGKLKEEKKVEKIEKKEIKPEIKEKKEPVKEVKPEVKKEEKKVEKPEEVKVEEQVKEETKKIKSEPKKEEKLNEIKKKTPAKKKPSKKKETKK